MKEGILVVLSMGFLVSFMFGFVHNISEGYRNNGKILEGCTHNSLLSKYSPGYRLGCILTKQRFKGK